MRGSVLRKSRDVEIVQVAGGVFRTGGQQNGGVGGKQGFMYWSSCDFLIQLVRNASFGSCPVFCGLMNAKRPSLHHAQPPGTSWMRSLETRFSPCGEQCLRRQALLVPHRPPVQLWPRASRCKLSSSQVVPNAHPSNTPTNTPIVGKVTRDRCLRMENTT